jgi:hypothetical protein
MIRFNDINPGLQPSHLHENSPCYSWQADKIEIPCILSSCLRSYIVRLCHTPLLVPTMHAWTKLRIISIFSTRHQLDHHLQLTSAQSDQPKLSAKSHPSQHSLLWFVCRPKETMRHNFDASILCMLLPGPKLGTEPFPTSRHITSLTRGARSGAGNPTIEELFCPAVPQICRGWWCHRTLLHQKYQPINYWYSAVGRWIVIV